MEHKALSQITPTEAQTLLSFMQAHIPEPKKFNPTMNWEESCQIDWLFDKLSAVLFCRANKEVGHDSINGGDQFDITTGMMNLNKVENIVQKGGLVVIFGDEVSGWMNELRDLQSWEPICKNQEVPDAN